MSKINSLVNDILASGLSTTGKEWIELVKLINSKPEEAKNFVNYIKSKIKTVSQDQQITLIDLLDYAMVEGKMPLHTQVATKDFISVLIALIKYKDNPEIQVKILYLIKKWGTKFENQKDILPNFYETYAALKKNNVVFPEKMSINYNDYIKSNSQVSQLSNVNLSEKDKMYDEIYANSASTSLDLNPNSYPKKYHKFVGELGVLMENIQLGNEMIDNSDCKKPMDEILISIMSNLKNLEKNLMLAIQNQIDNEKLMEICLGFNDDINKTFLRYEELRNKKKPSPFISCFTNTASQKHHHPEQVKKDELSDVFANLNVADTKPVNSNINPSQSSNNNPVDIFDFINNPNQQTNLNNNPNPKPGFQFTEPEINKNVQAPEQNSNTNQNKTADINDLINNIYKNEYGLGINNPSPGFNQNQNNNMNFGNFPGQSQVNNSNSKQNNDLLNDIFDFTKNNNQQSPNSNPNYPEFK